MEKRTKGPEPKGLPAAMAFYHENGFVPAWKLAMRYAGKDGRVATLPDILAARIATAPKLAETDPEFVSGIAPWEKYYTTMSAEYVGLSSAGHPVIIVAHGVGPMSTFDGVMAAYHHDFKRHDGRSAGGLITIEEFRKLESGACGEVAVVDLKAYCAKYRYPFIESYNRMQSMHNPLVQARMGKDCERYLEAHHAVAAAWDRRRGDPDPTFPPRLIHLGADSNKAYYPHLVEHPEAYPEVSGGKMAFAHLLSIGQVMQMHCSRSDCPRRMPCPTSDIACHSWSDGTRLIGIRSGEALGGIHPGPNPRALSSKHWERLLRPAKGTKPSGFYALMKFGGTVFTQVPKMGEGMDTAEPEFPVKKAEEVPGPTTFRTTIGGYHGFFKYGIREVERIAPKGANAYLIDDGIEIVYEGGSPKYHDAPITFYRAEVDTSKRMPRESELADDFDLQLALLLS